jgi:hypothetical protein
MTSLTLNILASKWESGIHSTQCENQAGAKVEYTLGATVIVVPLRGDRK